MTLAMVPGEEQPRVAAPPRRGVIRRSLRLAFRILGLFLLISVLWTAVYAVLPVPLTPLMVIRLVEGYGFSKHWMSYEKISPNLARAAIASEDSGFCVHHGFEWEAIRNAWDRNQRSRRIRGGSTISNQTAKNAFLWPDRTYVRKGLEYYFTGLVELMWGKKRILEVYLNVVEFGPGVYGAEAASRHYFGKSAASLTETQAAQLAASLPRPRTWHPGVKSKSYQKKVRSIQRRMSKARWLRRQV
jgi:monofunctional biosynthetic peptidoglycan transglycosylase